MASVTLIGSPWIVDALLGIGAPPAILARLGMSPVD